MMKGKKLSVMMTYCVVIGTLSKSSSFLHTPNQLYHTCHHFSGNVLPNVLLEGHQQQLHNRFPHHSSCCNGKSPLKHVGMSALDKLIVRGGGYEKLHTDVASSALGADADEVNGTSSYSVNAATVRLTPPPAPSFPYPPWSVNVMIAIIFLGTFIAYFERQGFSVVMTDVAQRAGLSQSAKGVVLSAYYYGYTLMQIPGSFLVSRAGPTKVLIGCFLTWAALALVMPTTVSAGTGLLVILALRACMGLAQGVMFPAWHNIMATVVPPTDRSKVPLASSGMFIGSATALAFLPALVETAGAQAELKLVGGLGLAWAFLWGTAGATLMARGLKGRGSGRSASGEGGMTELQQGEQGQQPTRRRGRKDQKAVAEIATRGAAMAGGYNKNDDDNGDDRSRYSNRGSGDTARSRKIGEGKRAGVQDGGIPWRGLIMSRPVWATIFGNIGFSYSLYALLNWMPTYFESYLGKSLRSLGSLGAVFPYFCMFVMTNVGAALGRYTLRVATERKLSQPALVARKVCNNVGFTMTLGGIAMMPFAKNVQQGLFWTAMALSGVGVTMSGWGVNHMDIAPKYAGPVIALSNTMGAAIGIIATASFGRILDVCGGPGNFSGWAWSFGLNSLAIALSILTFEKWAKIEVLFQ